MNSEYTFAMMHDTIHGMAEQIICNVHAPISIDHQINVIWACIHWQRDMIRQLAGEG